MNVIYSVDMDKDQRTPFISSNIFLFALILCIALGTLGVLSLFSENDPQTSQSADTSSYRSEQFKLSEVEVSAQ